MKDRSYATSEVKQFITKLNAAKQAEQAGGVRIFEDNLLKVTVVVESGGDWFIVPKSKNGWQQRQRLRLTPLVELERLRPVHIDAGWLGIGNV